MSEIIIDRNEQETERNRLGRVKTAARWAGGLAAAGAVAAGSFLMLRNGNMEDFEDLRQLTSPAHAEDRQKLQEAFDAQDEMRLNFDEKGGPTDAEVTAMATFTGLEEEQVEALVTTELYAMDYDGGEPWASSAEATMGLAVAAAGVGAAVGAGVMAATRRQ